VEITKQKYRITRLKIADVDKILTWDFPLGLEKREGTIVYLCDDDAFPGYIPNTHNGRKVVYVSLVNDPKKQFGIVEGCLELVIEEGAADTKKYFSPFSGEWV
jgi:hypothetical protein